MSRRSLGKSWFEDMSGHSKWHNIQVRKGKQDKVRSNLFTKLSRAITVAAREGGGDLGANFALRLAIDKARAANMPRENIDRAIKRGTGELKDETAFEEVIYEGFGPGGVAVIVEAYTDNKNRTVADVKAIFGKYGGSLGSPGSVKWQFVRLGVIRVSNEPRATNREQSTTNNQQSGFELSVIEAGADDIIDSEFGLEIRCPIAKLQKVMETVQLFGIQPDESGMEWVAKEEVRLDERISEKVATLVGALEEHDDIRSVYTNES